MQQRIGKQSLLKLVTLCAVLMLGLLWILRGPLQPTVGEFLFFFFVFFFFFFFVLQIQSSLDTSNVDVSKYPISKNVVWVNVLFLYRSAPDIPNY